MVLFVKRRLGDDVLSVELTKRQVWAAFEEAFLEYNLLINSHNAENQIGNVLGIATGSLEGLETAYPRENLEFFLRQAEPYAADAGLGGNYVAVSGSITLEPGRQDYDIYNELVDHTGSLVFDNPANSPRSNMKILEVFHFSPQAAYRFFDTTSAINYLNNEFAFESFTPETVFYVLPVFEDVLRGGQLDLSNRVRRSNYSYRITGTKIRIYPTPTTEFTTTQKLFMLVSFAANPLDPPYDDASISGANSFANLPYGNLEYSKVNSPGRQWVRQYCLAVCKEMLGLIRNKYSSIPIPDGDVTLNGSDLVSQGREDQEKLKTTMRETLDKLTYKAILESESTEADQLNNILKRIPIPMGKAIIIG